MEKDKSLLSSSALMTLLIEKRQTLDSDLQQCKRTLNTLKAGQGHGGSAEQIGRWETTKEMESKQIRLEGQLELIDELLTERIAAQ